MHVVVQRRVDAVPGQNREADVLQRPPEGFGETRLVACIAVQEGGEIERGDFIIIVERIVVALGQAVAMGFAHLVVALEIAVGGGGVGHGAATAVAGTSPPSSRRPLAAARNIVVEA